MTPLEQARATLDEVEADGYRMFNGEGEYDFREELPDKRSIARSARYGRKWEPIYSRETVESLLQAHELRIRKQVLLEAAEHFNGMGAWSEHHLRNELRRMAEGEK